MEWRLMKMQQKSIRPCISRISFLTLFILCSLFVFSQKNEPPDSDKTALQGIIIPKSDLNDLTAKKIYSPRKAALRSAILPGLGQIYNKKYWKLPIVYGALGVSTGVFLFNLGWYKKTRYAYKVLVTKDTSNYPNVDHALQFLIKNNDANGLRHARDQYRRDIDYSALFFLILWGLNVVDATVDAHLKGFDVSPNLGLQVKPGYSDMAGTNGLSIVLNFR